jgi:Flp pilus assembly protein TadD
MDRDHSADSLRPGVWIRISGLDARDLICFTYVDQSKGLCAKGSEPDDPDLAERPTRTIHSLHMWPHLRWRLLDVDEVERFSLPAVPPWAHLYGSQPHPDASWDPLLDEPGRADAVPGRLASEQSPHLRVGDMQRIVRQWQIGDYIDGRVKIEQIFGGPGKSGMGTVYVGYDALFGQVCALKTLQDQFLQDAAMRARFKREALTWIGFDAHDNVTQALLWDYLDGRPCLHMEYVSGGDLGQWIGRPELTDHPNFCVRLALDLCDGMIHAVSKGLRAHRDIKPQNCLLTSGGTPRLLVTDFGLARVMDDRTPDAGSPTSGPGLLAVHRTRYGQAVGTCTHMAPEQFDNARDVDIRADVYAFGILMYQMLTGRLPFEGRTWDGFRWLHMAAPPPPLPQHFGAELNSLVTTCLAKDPDARYPDFAPIRRQLTEIYGGLTGGQVHQGGRERMLGGPQQSMKAMSLAFLGSAPDALKVYERAIAMDPPGSLADWEGKTAALRQLGRYDDALACIDEAMRIHASSDGLFAAWLRKGEVLYALQHYEDALTCFDRATELNPSFDIGWSLKGVVLFELRRYGEAAECYDRLLKLDPNDPDDWWYAGEALRKSGRNVEAISRFDRAISLRPAHYGAWTNKALALAAHGGKDEEAKVQALYSIDQALAMSPSDATVWFHKGTLLVWYRREEEAVECFAKAHRLGHQSAAAMIEAIQVRQDRP